MSSGHIIDQDGKFTFIVDGLFTSVKVADNGWIGLGSGKGRIEFDDQATDEINFLDCNVGIGTSTPSKKLDVLGDVKIQSAIDSTTAIQFLDADGGEPILNIDTLNERVGIGKRSTEEILYVKSKAAATNVFAVYAVTGGSLWRVRESGGNNLFFSIFNSAGNEVIKLDPASTENSFFATGGNFGIGAITFGTNAAGTFAMANGTAPTGDVADQFAMFAADLAAGNSIPYFRSENGTVIGLNQSLLTTDNVNFAELSITGLSLNIAAKTAAYTATATDDVITCGAGNETFTVDLPVPVNKKVYYVKNVGTGLITVDAQTTGSTTIDGQNTQQLVQFDTLMVIAGASVYHII